MKNVVAVALFVAEIGWLGAHMLGGSIYLEYLTGINPTLSKAIVAVGFGLYVIVGGYLADVITDAVQGVSTLRDTRARVCPVSATGSSGVILVIAAPTDSSAAESGDRHKEAESAAILHKRKKRRMIHAPWCASQ